MTQWLVSSRRTLLAALGGGLIPFRHKIADAADYFIHRIAKRPYRQQVPPISFPTRKWHHLWIEVAARPGSVLLITVESPQSQEMLSHSTVVMKEPPMRMGVQSARDLSGEVALTVHVQSKEKFQITRAWGEFWVYGKLPVSPEAGAAYWRERPDLWPCIARTWTPKIGVEEVRLRASDADPTDYPVALHEVAQIRQMDW